MPKKKVEERTTQKFEHIEAKSITVKASDNGPSVSIMATAGATGVWVSNGDKGSVALVAQENMAPYFIIWGKDNKYPPLAIATDPDGKLNIQVVDTGECSHPGDHWMQHVQFVNGADLAQIHHPTAPPPA